MLLFLILCALSAFILFCAIRVGDERRYLDIYEGELKVYTFYNSDYFKIKADFSHYEDTGRITLYVWTRRRDPGTEKPQIDFFPHGTVRVSKETGEVYDWFEY